MLEFVHKDLLHETFAEVMGEEVEIECVLEEELTDKTEKLVNDVVNNSEVIIYGRVELMVMKYCPLKKCLNYCNNCI